MSDQVLITVNILLVLVTAFYAWQTKRMTDASTASANYAKEATQAARKAAEAAEASATAAIAGLQVEFSVSPSYGIALEEADDQLGVSVVCEGSTVYLHGGLVRRVYVGVKPRIEAEAAGREFRPWLRTPVELAPEGPSTSPRLLHRGEQAEFWVPGVSAPREGVAGLEVTLRYSLDGTSEPVERQVSYRGELDRDYQLVDQAPVESPRTEAEGE